MSLLKEEQINTLWRYVTESRVSSIQHLQCPVLNPKLPNIQPRKCDPVSREMIINRNKPHDDLEVVLGR